MSTRFKNPRWVASPSACSLILLTAARALAQDAPAPPASSAAPAPVPVSSPASSAAPAPASPKPPKDAPVAPNVEAPASAKRPLPDYDGRGPRPSTVGDDLLWVPRIVVSPIYLTTEYVIRRPLGAAISAAERSNVPKALYDFFVFGPEHTAGILPTIYFDFGFSPSVGLFGFWNDAGFKGNNVSAHFSVWTSDWIAGSLGERIRFGKGNDLTLQLAAIRRPDRAYFGEGPSSLQGNISRYGETRFEGSEGFNFPLWRSSQIQLGSGIRSVDTYHGDYDGDPSVEQQAAHGIFPVPYGFGQEYLAEFNHAIVAFDTRQKHGSKSGVRLEAQAEQGSELGDAPNGAWLRYQGTAGFFYDLNGRGRVLSLVGTALFADPLANGGVIPFTELVTLGGNTPILSALATGNGLMPGLYAGRLVDRSAAVATLQYRWPIWAWLDGSLQVATGNVFGDHLDGFNMGLMRFSGALGIESTGATDSDIHLLIGIGSETFDHGGQIDSIRLAFGTSRF